MNSPAFLLALAPAATAVASQTLAAAKNTGESFVSMLGNLLNSPTTSGAVEQPETKPTLTETVQSLAAGLRNWLSEHGASKDYAIDYHQAADGETQLNVDGEAAEQVKQLLASDPSWMAKFRELASSLQAQSAQFSRDYTAPSVTISIDEHDAKVY